jgi:hypothetical protein
MVIEVGRGKEGFDSGSEWISQREMTVIVIKCVLTHLRHYGIIIVDSGEISNTCMSPRRNISVAAWNLANEDG